jgi:catechol 2,3-dioxygenase-like lactoylglutathione lyase family enzyme
MPTFERVSPILCVTDVVASIAYYTEQLGFRLGFAWGDPVTFGSVTRDGVEVMFCLDGQGAPGTWFTIWVDDVDALFREFTERRGDIRQPPVNLSWGVREMNVADPDGHRIRFSTLTGEASDEVDLPFGQP